MSTETAQWLNTMTLHGYGRKPWHYKEELNADTIYPDAIPVEDVRKRLFDFSVAPLPVFVAIPATVETADTMNAEGEPIRYVNLTDRMALAPNDRWGEDFGPEDIFGVFSEGYTPHQYGEWLIDKVAEFRLPVGTAGLLKNRGVAWVSFETADTYFKAGVDYFPRLLVGTSHNGSMSTAYKLVHTLTVCDNTFAAAMGERSPSVKVKHTRGSHTRAKDISDKLGLLQQSAEDFGTELEALTNTAVTDAQWQSILERLVPDKDTKSGATRAQSKRDELMGLWQYDSRVNPWKNTLFGVLQATNTWEQHRKPTKGATVRQERNWLDTLTGAVENEKATTLRIANEVLAEVA